MFKKTSLVFKKENFNEGIILSTYLFKQNKFLFKTKVFSFKVVTFF